MNVENISVQKYYEQSSKVESPAQNKNQEIEHEEELGKSGVKNVELGNNVQHQQMNLATNLAPLLHQSRVAQEQIANGYVDIKI